jgi:hypothetical protein
MRGRGGEGMSDPYCVRRYSRRRLYTAKHVPPWKIGAPLGPLKG